MKSILFVGCHCDDIELGCGGTIVRWSADREVHCLTLSRRMRNGFDLKASSLAAMQVLGAASSTYHELVPSEFAAQDVWELLSAHRAKHDLIVIQEPDQHHDHETLYASALRVFIGESLATYVSSSVSCPNFTPNFYVPLGEEQVRKKLEALEHYEMYRSKPYFNPDLIRSQMVAHGVQIGRTYAEALRIVRLSDDALLS